MRKSLLILCSFLLLSGKSTSQIFLSDTLNQLLAKTPKGTIQEVDVLLGQVRMFVFTSKYEEAEALAKKAIQLSRRLHYLEGEARAYIFLSMTVTPMGSIEEGAGYIRTGIKLAKAIPSRDIEVFGLYNLAEYYMYDKNDLQRGMEILTDALSKIDETVTNKNKGNVYKVLGVCLSESGKYEQALNYLEQALYHFEQVGIAPEVNPQLGRPSADLIDGGLLNTIHVLIYLSRVSRSLGQFQQTMNYIQQALTLCKKIHTPNLESWVHEEMGGLQQLLGNYEEAIQHFKIALEIYQDIDVPRFESDVLKAFGYLYIELEDWQQAQQSFEKALAIDDRTNDSLATELDYLALGDIMRLQNRTDEALVYYTDALAISQTLGDSVNLAGIYYRFGGCWKQKGDLDKALAYYRQTLQLNKQRNEFTNSVGTHLSLARLFQEARQLDSALYYANTSLQLAKTYGVKDQFKDIHLTLSQLFEAQSDFEQALVHHKAFFQYHDSLYRSDVQQTVKAEQVRQNVEDYKKEQQLATEKAMLLATRNQLYLALAGTLIGILALGLYFFFQLRKAKQQLQTQNIQLTNLNQTKDRFFSIIAHDIRSPLVTFQGVGEQFRYYLEKNKQENLFRLANHLDRASQRLSALLDNLLNWALLQQGMMPYHPEELSVAQIVEENVELYENAAQAKNILLTKDVSPDLYVYADANALNTILRNLISNALKYTEAGGQVVVKASEKGGDIYVEIADTGRGIDTMLLNHLFTLDKNSQRGTAGEKGTGLGLVLCKELIELNHGYLNVKSELGKGSQFLFSLQKAQ